MSTAVLAATNTVPAVPAVPLKSEATPAEGTPAAVQQNDVDAADSGACVVESTTTTSAAAPAHKIQRWERTLAATTEAPVERFEAKLVRWRRLGKNLVFLDVVKTGRDDEWQLACAAATFPPAAERADLVVVEAREEPACPRRGLRRCAATRLQSLRKGHPRRSRPRTRIQGKRRTCSVKGPRRHVHDENCLPARVSRRVRGDVGPAPAVAAGPPTSNRTRRTRSRRTTSTRTATPGASCPATTTQRRHAARHVEFGAWIVDRRTESARGGPRARRGRRPGPARLGAPVRPRAPGGARLDPRKAKVPRKSRRKLLRKRLAALTLTRRPGTS